MLRFKKAFKKIITKKFERRVSRKDLIYRNTEDAIDPSMWMVLYGSTMTIFLVLFLVLFLLARKKDTASQQQLRLLETAFKGKEYFNLLKKDIESIAQLEKDTKKEQGSDFSMSLDGEYINIMLAENVLFEKGKFEVNEVELDKILNSVITKFKKNHIIVEGHTDNIPVLGGKLYKSNWELSTMRALSVVRYLIKKGFAGENIRAFGYGEYKPIASNDTEEGRCKNRRIEIKIQRLKI